MNDKIERYKEYAFKRGIEAALKSPVLTNFMTKSRALNVALIESNTSCCAEEYREFRKALLEMLKVIERIDAIEAIDPDKLPSGLTGQISFDLIKKQS